MGNIGMLKNAYKLVKKLNSKDATDKDRKAAEDLIDSVLGKKSREKLMSSFSKPKKEVKK